MRLKTMKDDGEIKKKNIIREIKLVECELGNLKQEKKCNGIH